MNRQIQSIGTAALGSGGSANFSLQSLPTQIAGQPANIAALVIRIAKTVTSVNRPSAASITIRDNVENLFEGTGLELLAQSRERGEAVDAQLGAVTAIDAAVFVWRPGYGMRVEDQYAATGLFAAGGTVQVLLGTDAGQTSNVEVLAVLEGGPPRVHQRVLTRTLAAGSRDLPGDFLLARLRDASFSDSAAYTVRSTTQDLITGAIGRTLRALYETSLGPAGDPVVLTAVAQSTISGPNLVRAMLADYSYGSGEKMPPLGELPTSGTNINLTAGFVGAPIVTQIFRRDRAQAENMMRLACDRAGIPYTGVQPIVDVPGLRGFSPYKPG